MSELKPGEYVGADGMIHRAHLHHSVEHGDGWWWPTENLVLPDDPDFAAAVEALAKLVEKEDTAPEWCSNCRFQRVGTCRFGPPLESDEQIMVRWDYWCGKYERERGHADE